VKSIGVLLNHFHWLKVLKLGALGYLVFSVVTISREVTYIRDIPYIAYFESAFQQISVNDIKRGKSSDVSKVHIVIHSGTTNIKSYMPGDNRFKLLLFPGQTIIEEEMVFHDAKNVMNLSITESKGKMERIISLGRV
jgi:hypothetical protein